MHEEADRMRQGIARIERVETKLVRDIGHELRNPHGAHSADRHVVEPALAPNQIGEESDRKLVRLRNCDKRRANLMI